MTPVPVSDGGTAAAIVGPRSMLCKYFLQSFAAHQPREAQVPNYVLSLDTKNVKLKSVISKTQTGCGIFLILEKDPLIVGTQGLLDPRLGTFG